MYQLAIVLDGILYKKSNQLMTAKVDGNAIIGYVKSYTDTFPRKDGETTISRDLIAAPYAKVRTELQYSANSNGIYVPENYQLNSNLTGKVPTSKVSQHLVFWSILRIIIISR